MEETVSRLDFGYQTGNPITDIIIHQKKQEADRAGVKFSVDFSYPKELQIDVYDIGVILNNALENAIEAAAWLNRNKYVSLHSYASFPRGDNITAIYSPTYKNHLLQF